MNNTFLLSLAVSIIPVLALGFVGILLLHKIYVKIRSKFNATVNCWFCNKNAKVPYIETNSWTCPHCEQYNGFTKDGDYNREIFQQLDCSNNTSKHDYSDHSSDLFRRRLAPPRNGFCNVCNEAQRLKVEMLAQFEPKNESHFDDELRAYKTHLEDQYRLCATCDRHLNKVLREKKKMVLGSKFLDFIIKGAETLKQPHFNQIRQANQQQWKRRIMLTISIFTVINLSCLLSLLPTLTRTHLTHYFGDVVGQQLFVICSHIVAFGRVAGAYFETICSYDIVKKCVLFLRTLFMMMMYTMGLKMPQIVRFNFAALHVLAYPFMLLGLTFGYNVVDGFKLTRYTLLLVLWSMFAGGLIEQQWLLLSHNSLMLLASFITILLTATSKIDTSPKLHDTTASSFHKIYSEDYLSDEDTISLLSQQFNCSNGSTHSSYLSKTHRSFGAPPSTIGAAASTTTGVGQQKGNMSRFTKSPLTSSVLSLNNMPRSQISPNSSFNTCYAASVCSFPPTNATTAINAPHMPLLTPFPSNIDLNSRDHRSQSTIFGMPKNPQSSFANASFANSTFSEAAHMTPLHATFHHSQKGDASSLFSPMTHYDSHSMQNGVAARGGGGFAMPLLSPFSAVSASVVDQQRSANLLTPSRFSTNCLATNTSAATTSWLSGGYFNQRPPLHHYTANIMYEQHRNGATGMTAVDENLSRASSQSSGFESQNGRLNISRENSLCSDAAELSQRTKALDKSFQPIESSSHTVLSRAFTPRPSVLSNPQLAKPLSVHCAEPLWKAPIPMRRNISGRDSFNLRKINEELPTIQRGDLLKKWKEGQAVS